MSYRDGELRGKSPSQGKRKNPQQSIGRGEGDELFEGQWPNSRVCQLRGGGIAAQEGVSLW